MHQSYKRLLNPNPKSRMSVGQFLDQGKRIGGFFQTPLIQVTEDIDNLGLKAEDERNELLGLVSSEICLADVLIPSQETRCSCR
jgi:SCY1-like protein 1